MAKKNKNSFGGANSFGKFKGSVFSGSTPKIESYKVEPIEGVFGGSIPNSLYTVERESTWSRWRRGWELGASNLTNTAYEYPFEYIIPTTSGAVDSITIIRDNTSDAVHADYTINADTSGTFIGLTKGQIVYVENTGVLTTPAESGQGYYTYTGDTALNVVNTAIHFSGVASPTASGFTFNSLSSTNLPAVTFVVYHTRGTTVPIPGDGDYVPVFSKTVPMNSGFVDCSDVMPELATPIPQQGNVSG